jgi:hypothetical protein
MTRFARLSIRMFAIALIALLGCTGGQVATPGPETTNLAKIQTAYLAAIEKNHRPPADEAEAMPFLEPLGKPAEILVSPIDHEPYVILWGVDWRKSPIPSMPPPIVAYEKTGQNGVRRVLTVMGVQTMTDDEFARATFIARKK